MTQPHRVNGYTEQERQRMCAGKVRYSDELTARAGGMISLEQHGNGYTKLYCYPCPICRGFHCTKKRKAHMNAITKEDAYAC